MTAALIHIDGSQGEGGGQVLRTALALSIATGQPFRMTGVRAGRAKPGLMRQHLTCLAAASDICTAEVEGAEPGSQEVQFRPGTVNAGEYSFAIGTAGSTTLVIQAILPPLLTAPGPSRITVEGGTHARGAPPVEFFQRALVPIINKMGPRVSVRLERYGFYPAGGGRLVVDIEPAPRLNPIDLHDRGPILERRGTIVHSQLGFGIAQRELDVINQRLNWGLDPRSVCQAEPCHGPGNAVILEIISEGITEVFSAMGEIGKSAENVAHEAVDQARAYLAAEHPVGPYLADQLMVFMALAGAGSFVTSPLSRHATTNTNTIAAFLPPPIIEAGPKRCTWRAG